MNETLLPPGVTQGLDGSSQEAASVNPATESTLEQPSEVTPIVDTASGDTNSGNEVLDAATVTLLTTDTEQKQFPERIMNPQGLIHEVHFFDGAADLSTSPGMCFSTIK